MKIKSAELIASAVAKSQYPQGGYKEIVLFGRSNVGKSSLINALVERKALARTSGVPGKTRLLNFYFIQASGSSSNLAWYFVDMPGYGYAKAAKSEREKWLRMMADYLSDGESDKILWQLVDIRHIPSKEDVEMCRVLMSSGFPLKVIATKADKISRGAQDRSLSLIAKELQVDKKSIVSFSAQTKEGRDQLWRLIEDFTAPDVSDSIEDKI